MKSILDSRQLLAFTMLARRGSFTLAAKDLFLTQSAVSHAIKALEEVMREDKRILLVAQKNPADDDPAAAAGDGGGSDAARAAAARRRGRVHPAGARDESRGARVGRCSGDLNESFPTPR